MGRTISVVTPAAAVKTLCYEGSTIGELRRAIAALLHVDSSTLKLIHNGQVLVQDEAACDVHDGGHVLVVKVVPKPLVPGGADERQDAAEDEFIIDRVQLRRKLCAYAAGVTLWFLCMSLAQRLEVGPVAFLVTIIVLIYVNLGTRRPGEASAYSIFNNFVRLPGQLTAEALDDQIRLGHM